MSARTIGFAVCAGFVLVPPYAAAQFVHPLRCLPPAGQGMYEIAASNLKRRYQAEPTAENKKLMCGRYESTIKVWENAVEGCSLTDCDEPSFLNACARAKEKSSYWRKRTKEECS